MKNIIIAILCFFTLSVGQAQTNNEVEVKKACLNYIEGFYEGDTNKLKASLQPTLHKFGFWKNKDTNEYRQVPHMSFDQAIAYAQRVLDNKEFAKPDAPKLVEILDIGQTIASAKVTAWWGIDYILLSKRGEVWMIEQVIWEGPLQKKN